MGGPHQSGIIGHPGGASLVYFPTNLLFFDSGHCILLWIAMVFWSIVLRLGREYM